MKLNPKPPLVYSCSGAPSAAQMVNQLAGDVMKAMSIFDNAPAQMTPSPPPLSHPAPLRKQSMGVKHCDLMLLL